MTYGDASPLESSPKIARERSAARFRPPLPPKLSRSRFNRAVWVNNPVGSGHRKEPVAKSGCLAFPPTNAAT